jgi:hypothetical protein
MKGAHAEGVAEGVEGDGLVEVAFDIAADGADVRGARVGCRLRPAAETGAKTCLLGVSGVFKKLNVLAERSPGWARRAAIDAGGGHGVYELAVVSGVAVENGLPAVGVSQVLCSGLGGVLGSHLWGVRNEYRIGADVCAHERSLGAGREGGYPDLAGVFRILRVA